MKIPAISVIIPMYNAEKYVGECLESILSNTFQDFEIIVVDDCSTDNSCAIVKNFSDNRIKLICKKRNSGLAHSQNLGLEISRGEYIFFMDNDDILMKNAFETMFTHAEKFQADVVNCAMTYEFNETDKDKIFISRKVDIKQPTFISEILSERLKAWFNGRTFYSPYWLKFVRRDFLTYNEIKFDNITRNDDLWTFKLVCLAKKYLIIPNICYIKRSETGKNLTTKKRSVNEYINYWFGRSVRSFKILDEFLAEVEFFQKSPEIRYMVLNFWLSTDLNFALNECAKHNLSLSEIYKIFNTEFKEYFGKNNAFISALITNDIANIFNLIVANKKNN